MVIRRRVRQVAVSAVAFAVLLVAGFPSPAHAEAGSYYLATGQYMGVIAGQTNIIQSGEARLVLQYDRNLVVYGHYNGAGGTQKVCWASNTNVQNPGPYALRAVMQQDGNFVEYLYAGGPAIWASGTDRPEYFGNTLVMTNSWSLTWGWNVVIYLAPSNNLTQNNRTIISCTYR